MKNGVSRANLVVSFDAWKISFIIRREISKKGAIYMNITQYSIDEILDPTNIIEGKRFEFLLDVEVDEDDELYSEAGLEIRAIVGLINEEVRIMNYFIIDKSNNESLEFALEEDEEAMILAFCKEELLAPPTSEDAE